MSDAVPLTLCQLESLRLFPDDWPGLDSTDYSKTLATIFSMFPFQNTERDSGSVLLASGLYIPGPVSTSRARIKAALNLGYNCSPVGACSSVLRNEDTFPGAWKGKPPPTPCRHCKLLGKLTWIREVRNLLCLKQKDCDGRRHEAASSRPYKVSLRLKRRL